MIGVGAGREERQCEQRGEDVDEVHPVAHLTDAAQRAQLEHAPDRRPRRRRHDDHEQRGIADAEQRIARGLHPRIPQEREHLHRRRLEALRARGRSGRRCTQPDPRVERCEEERRHEEQRARRRSPAGETAFATRQHGERGAGRERVEAGGRRGVRDQRRGAGRDEPDAQRERADEERGAHREQATLGNAPHHERPEQVEVLLDRERPGDVEGLVLPGADPRDLEVGQVQPVPDALALGARIPEVVRGLEEVDARHEHEKEDEHRVVEREDAQYATRIEGAVVARTRLRAQQDSGDQEPRQHEEEIDAGPADRRHDPERLLERRPGEPVVRRVVEHHQRHREAAQAVEARLARPFGCLRRIHWRRSMAAPTASVE